MTKPAPQDDDGIRQVATIDYSVPRKGGGQEWHQMEVHLNDAFKEAIAEVMAPIIAAEKEKTKQALALAKGVLDCVALMQWNRHTADIALTVSGKDGKLGSYAIIPTHLYHEAKGKLDALTTTTGDKP